MPAMTDRATILPPTLGPAVGRSLRLPGHLKLEVISPQEARHVHIVGDAIPTVPLGWGEWDWAWATS